MHCFRCREAVQSGCNLSPTPTLLPGGRFLQSHSSAMQAGGNPKWASITSKAQWVRAPGPPTQTVLSCPQRWPEWACTNGEFPHKWGVRGRCLLWHVEIQLETHPINWNMGVSAKICFQSFLNSQNQNYYMISTAICEIQRKIPLEFLMLKFQWLK